MKYFIWFNLDADLFFHSGRYFIENYSIRWREGVMRLQGPVLLLQCHSQNCFSKKSIHLEPNGQLWRHNLSFHFHKMYWTLSWLETATTLTPRADLKIKLSAFEKPRKHYILEYTFLLHCKRFLNFSKQSIDSLSTTIMLRHAHWSGVGELRPGL